MAGDEEKDAALIGKAGAEWLIKHGGFLCCVINIYCVFDKQPESRLVIGGELCFAYYSIILVGQQLLNDVTFQEHAYILHPAVQYQYTIFYIIYIYLIYNI